MKAFAHCNECKKTNQQVRLYRPYGNFYRVEDNACNEHVPEGSRGWYVPLVFDEDGGVWGYTSVPEEACKAFYSLPEADLTGYTWCEQAKPGVTHWHKV